MRKTKFVNLDSVYTAVYSLYSGNSLNVYHVVEKYYGEVEPSLFNYVKLLTVSSRSYLVDDATSKVQPPKFLSMAEAQRAKTEGFLDE